MIIYHFLIILFLLFIPPYLSGKEHCVGRSRAVGRSLQKNLGCDWIETSVYNILECSG